MSKKIEGKIFSVDGGRTQFRIADRFANRTPEFQIHERETLTLTGRLTVSLVEKFGLVTSEPDGEDSAGRASLKLMPPNEVALRAVSLAEATVKALRERNHTSMLPSYEEALGDEETDAS